MKNGNTCYCGSSYGSEGAGECTMMCSEKPCGGNDSVSVYATGYVSKYLNYMWFKMKTIA